MRPNLHRALPRLTRSHATALPIDTQARPQSLSTASRRYTKSEIAEIYHSPLLELVYRAAEVHRQHHDPSKIQLCTLLNIKSMSISHAFHHITHLYARITKPVAARRIVLTALSLLVTRRRQKRLVY
jgi:hypothetical protein